MAYTKVAPSRSSSASIVYARDGKDGFQVKCVKMSGLNCDPSNAEYEFGVVRRAYNKAVKEGKDIQARLVIQSFKGRDVSADEVNEMGYELAEKIDERLGGGFQAAVYTHGNTGNYHNHIVFNAVNAGTGKKYTMLYEKFEIEKMSDEIALERGLRVIEKQREDISTTGEVQLRADGKYVWKDDLKERFNHALDKTLSNLPNDRAGHLEQFKDNLNDLGVNVKERYVKKRDTTYFTYTFTDENGKQRTANEKRLGLNYGAQSVIERTERRSEKNRIETLELERKALETPPEAESPQKRGGFVAPAEIERRRELEIGVNRPLEAHENEKTIQTTQIKLNRLEAPIRVLRIDSELEEERERERVRKKVLEYAQEKNLLRNGEFKLPIMYLKESDTVLAYHMVSQELDMRKRHQGHLDFPETFKYEYHDSPAGKLFEGERTLFDTKEYADRSLFETLKESASNQGVENEFLAAHEQVKQMNRRNQRYR